MNSSSHSGNGGLPSHASTDSNPQKTNGTATSSSPVSAANEARVDSVKVQTLVTRQSGDGQASSVNVDALASANPPTKMGATAAGATVSTVEVRAGEDLASEVTLTQAARVRGGRSTSAQGGSQKLASAVLPTEWPAALESTRARSSGVEVKGLEIQSDRRSDGLASSATLRSNGRLEHAFGSTAPVSLLTRLVRGERSAALIFAGQGIPYLAELRELEANHRAAGKLIRDAAALIEETVELPLFRRSGYYTEGFELLTWLHHPSLAPSEAYLSSSVISQSLVFLLQCARYISLYDEGLKSAFEAGAIKALTGHSQGIMPALMVAEAPLGKLNPDRVLELVRYYLYQGLHMQDSFGGMRPGRVRDGEATPMAAVSRLDLKSLQKSVDAVNRTLGSDEQLFVTLHNTRTRHVISGPASALSRLRQALELRAEQEKKDKARGRFAGMTAAFDWEYLPVSGAFHSPYMAQGLARMRETAQALGFKLEAERLQWPVLSPSTGLPLNSSPDLTETLLQFQFLEAVKWEKTLHALSRLEGVTDVLDFGPGDAVSKLSAVCLRGSGIRVLPVALPSGQKSLFGEDTGARELNYQAFQPQLLRLPDGKVCIDNAFTRFTGMPPVILPGMTPTTVEAPLVAAAANGGFMSELAGGGQVTEVIFRERVQELKELLQPDREVVFNALYLDPYLWGLHFKSQGLVVKLKQEGAPLCGVTVSAGIPEVEEASRLLDELNDAGIWLNAFKPGTLAQIDAVLKIAEANPHRTILIQIEGGKAGGHHSWEDLDQLLLERYHRIRLQSNLILCVGGGIGDETRAVSLLTGRWAEVHGQPPMAVDAVFLGTLAMACKEAQTSPQVKQALVGAVGTDKWVFSETMDGGITSGKSSLNADIHYLENAAARFGRWLDQLAQDPNALANALKTRRSELIDGLNATARPYFGELSTMSYREVLERLIDLMAVGRGGRYEDGIWLDRSYRERVADFVRRAEARVITNDTGEFESVLTDLKALDNPAQVVERFQVVYGSAVELPLHPADVNWFVHGICRRPGKPVNFVPVLDEQLRSWFKSDSLWQSHDDRYSADQVLVIPGPEAVRGIVQADEPVASLLERFHRAMVDSLESAGARAQVRDTLHLPKKVTRPRAVAEGLVSPEGSTLKLELGDSPVESEWFEFLSSHFGGPLMRLLGRPQIWEGSPQGPGAEATRTDSAAPSGYSARANGWNLRPNPLRLLLRPQKGAVLTLTPTVSNLSGAAEWKVERLHYVLPNGEWVSAVLTGDALEGQIELQAGGLSFGLLWQLQAGRDVFLLSDGDFARALRRFYFKTLFGLEPSAVSTHSDASLLTSDTGQALPSEFAAAAGDFAALFVPQHTRAQLANADVCAYAAITGAQLSPQEGQGIPLNMAFTLAWEPLFAVISHERLAGGLLNLVHLSNRFEPGAGWWSYSQGVSAAELVNVTARLLKLEDSASGRTLTTEVLLRREGDAASMLRIESAFFIRGKFGQSPFKHLSWSPVDEPISLTEQATRQYLATHPLIVWHPTIKAEDSLVLATANPSESAHRRLKGWMGSVVARSGQAVHGAQLQIMKSGELGKSESTGELQWVKETDVAAHPVNSLLEVLREAGASATARGLPVASKRMAQGSARAPRSLKTFAEVGRDGNPLHVSSLMARLAGLDQPIVHGMWTSARAHAFLVETVAKGNAARIQRFETSFLAPTLPGERLRLRATRVGAHEGSLELEVTVHAERLPTTALGEAASEQASEPRLVLVMSGKALLLPPRTAYVFPGQGIQKPGMGMEGYARSAAARGIWERADLFTRDALGFSLLKIVRENPRELVVKGQALIHEQGVLHLTQFTQVAMAVLAQAQVAELREAGLLVEDAVLCGHSVGEYNTFGALSGVLALETVIQMVYERGCTMHRLIARDAQGESGYRMGVIRPHMARLNEAAAVALVEQVSRETGLPLQIVNYNIRGKQYSVTGRREALIRLEQVLADRTPPGSKGAYLEVPGIDTPFHSHLLRNGVADFRKALEARFPEELPFERLVGRYIPNLVPRPFSLSREYIQEVADYTDSPILSGILTQFETWQATPGRLARALLIELLSWQFASPVRWIETQELMLKPESLGGLGVERVIEVGVGYQPTLTNMARASLQILREARPGRGDANPGAVASSQWQEPQIVNIEADRDVVFCLDSDADSASRADEQGQTAPIGATAAVSRAADVATAVKASAQAAIPSMTAATPAVAAAAPNPSGVSAAPPGPLTDIPVTIEESLRTLLALQARVRPEQISAQETIDQLFEGVSSRRNQVLIDLGQEFALGTLDGAHEKPLSVLIGELAGRARSWVAPGRYTRAAQDEALTRVLGPAGMSRKDVLAFFEKTWGINGGLATGALNAFTLATRAGASGRGGALGELGTVVVSSRKDAENLLDQVVTLLAASKGLTLARAGTGAARGGDVVDAAAVNALSEQVLGADGVLMRAARKLAQDLGHPLDGPAEPGATGMEQGSTASIAEKLAGLQAHVTAELSSDFLEQVTPRFSPRRHVMFASAFAHARRDLGRLYYEGLNPARASSHDLEAEVQRLCAFAATTRPELATDRLHFSVMARQLAARAARGGALTLAQAFERIAAGVGSPGGSLLATFGREVLAANASASGPAVKFGPEPSTHVALAELLTTTDSQPFDFHGKTALVTGAGPGSIALEAVQQLLRGGARVILTTSNLSRERLGAYRKLYQRCAAPDAELHVVPFNQASMQDVNALIQWLFDPVTEQVGAQTKVIKRPYVPDLVLPFAATGEMATVDQLSGRSELTLRTLLLSVERMIGAIANRLKKDGMGAPCHVILPLSPNHGGFGGDGAYAESKAALEVLLTKWQSERDAWGRYVTLCAAKIGWVRSTGLMAGNDVLAGPLESETGLRTFSSAEMGYLIAALCSDVARTQARSMPLEADLTGGFSHIQDLKGTVDRIRQQQQSLQSNEKKLQTLRTQEASKQGIAGKSVLRLRALPWWPERPKMRGHGANQTSDGTGLSADHKMLMKQKKLDGSRSSSMSVDQWMEKLEHTPLHNTVVIVGSAEIGPWGSSRTRFEVEVEDRLSPAGVLELAWMTGLVRYEQGEKGGGWVDVASGEAVAEHELAERYEPQVRARSGIRFMETEHTGFDPEAMTVLAPVFLEEPLSFRVASEAEARAFIRRDPSHTTAAADAARGDWVVTRLKGARIHVPRVTRLTRSVAGQVPTGLDFTRFGIPQDMVDNVDRLTLFNLVATVDAFISSGFSPEELMSWVHPARVANTQGAGIGGMRSLQRLYTDHLVGKARQTDILQETLINVIAGYVVQSYVGSYGSMAHPVGACATAAVSVEEGFDKILAGKADFVVAGGFDDIGIEGAIGFSDMNATADTDEMKAMGLEPAEMSRPNDLRRRGFVEGQGGGTVLMTRGDLAIAVGLPVLSIVGYAGSFGDGIQKSVPAPGLGILACAAGGSRSPLAQALRRFELGADDIALVYKHDTSTAANDPNENNLHHEIQKALGRTEGHPLFVVSQKSLTGHSKGGAAAWQLLGLSQSLNAGVIPGNRNLDCLDPSMARYHHLVFSDAPVYAGERSLKAGLATSLGFGHVGAIVLLLAGSVFEDQVRRWAGESVLSDWLSRVDARHTLARQRRAEIWMGTAQAYEKRHQRRFLASDGTEAQLQEEIQLLTDDAARLDLLTGHYAAGEPAEVSGTVLA